MPQNLRISNTQNENASANVTFQWEMPLDNGGDDMNKYILTVSPGSGLSSVTVTMATIELAYNIEYTVRVSATNCAGRGPDTVLGPFVLSRGT